MAPISAQTPIAPEKQAAIKELIDIMHNGLKVSDMVAMVRVESDRASEETAKLFIAENKTISAADQKMIEEIDLKDSLRTAKRFARN